MLCKYQLFLAVYSYASKCVYFFNYFRYIVGITIRNRLHKMQLLPKAILMQHVSVTICDFVRVLLPVM